MTGLRWLVHVGLTGIRWLLPWISILLVSAAIAFAMTGSWTPYWWSPAVSASPAAEGRAPETTAYDIAVRDLRGTCTSLFGSYNYWLFERDSQGPCGLGVAGK